MPVLIDAWNLIRCRASAISDDGPDFLASARKLIACLQEFQMTHSDPIIAVFDSRREFLDVPYRNSPKLTIIAARDADDYIMRYIDSVPERQRRNIRVVSSDNSVYFHAKSSYATPLRSEEFWGKLNGTANPRP